MQIENLIEVYPREFQDRSHSISDCSSTATKEDLKNSPSGFISGVAAYLVFSSLRRVGYDALERVFLEVRMTRARILRISRVKWHEDLAPPFQSVMEWELGMGSSASLRTRAELN
jgi:hypothetical protein